MSPCKLLLWEAKGVHRQAGAWGEVAGDRVIIAVLTEVRLHLCRGDKTMYITFLSAQIV